MSKGKGLAFTLFAALGAIAGYASYMAKKDEFSDETKDKYDTFLLKAKNLGQDIQRTYTSIGDKSKFTNNTKTLSINAKKFASNAGNLVLSATSDIYKSAKKNVAKRLSNSDFKSNASKSSKKINKKSNKSNSQKKSSKKK